MTTKTQSPSDAAIDDAYRATFNAAPNRVREAPQIVPQLVREFARAVLARWGALASVVEPVARVYTMEALVPGGSIKHHVELLKPLPAGTKLYTAPPTQPAARMPLTDEQILNRRSTGSSPGTVAYDIELARFVEALHGITTQGDSNAD